MVCQCEDFWSRTSGQYGLMVHVSTALSTKTQKYEKNYKKKNTKNLAMLYEMLTLGEAG